jgi:hypothetical protein
MQLVAVTVLLLCVFTGIASARSLPQYRGGQNDDVWPKEDYGYTEQQGDYYEPDSPKEPSYEPDREPQDDEFFAQDMANEEGDRRLEEAWIYNDGRRNEFAGNQRQSDDFLFYQRVPFQRTLDSDTQDEPARQDNSLGTGSDEFVFEQNVPLDEFESQNIRDNDLAFDQNGEDDFTFEDTAKEFDFENDIIEDGTREPDADFSPHDFTVQFFNSPGEPDAGLQENDWDDRDFLKEEYEKGLIQDDWGNEETSWDELMVANRSAYYSYCMF